jgi:SagB-type dehydrogenase family enzyme
VSRRNYPGGGARYELEIYPLVHDVEGLPAGSYHYDPQAHELERIGDATAAVQASLAFAGRVATRRTPPRVLFVITARIGRVSWKYESIAYSLVLKHVGVLYSVMYDTATAMGLSPCALGAGNLDYYALATTTDPILEPAVGEFILGGAPLAMPDLRAR